MLHTTAHEDERKDPAEALMREVGAQLRQVRLERGEEIDEVAEYLRIKAAYLQALEHGDLGVMPGRTYALGFLRSYADYLGFDGDDLITQIRSTVDDLTRKTRLHIRTPMPESRLPKTPILVLSLVLVALVYAGWSHLNRADDLTMETVAEVPQSLRRLTVEQPSAPAAPERAALPGAAPAAGPARTGALEPLVPGGAVRIEAGDGPLQPQKANAQDSAEDRPARTDGAAPGQLTEAPAASAPAAEPEADGSAPAPARLAELTASGPDAAGRAAPVEASELPAVAPEAGPEDDAPGDPEAERVAAVATLGPAAQPPGGSAPVEPGARAESTPSPAVAEVLASFSGSGAAPADGGPQLYEPQNTDARVIIRGLESSWVRIESANGDYLRTRTLGRGDVFLVPNRDDLVLWTGNAGGLQLTVDGTTLPPIGERGRVRRQLELDPDRLARTGGGPDE